MRKALGLAALTVATSLIPAPASQACGDKLVPLGGGVRFEQIHVSRHPGKIILFLNPATQLPAANQELRLDAALERAGHAVRTVANLDDLEKALQTADPDLVLMDWHDVAQLHAELQSDAGSPPFLRVLYRPTADELIAAREQDHCVASAARRKGRTNIIQSVEQMLERRDKGLPQDCGRTNPGAAPL
jgi:hypothetical protein